MFSKDITTNFLKFFGLSIVVITICVYLVYASLVISPKSYKYFSLINDGEGIYKSQIISDCIVQRNCQNLIPQVVFERQFKRFRPAYWLFRYIQNSVGLDATLQHQFRVYIIGSILALLMFICVLDMGGNIFAGVIGIITFFGNEVFTDQISDLGSVEPFQLILVVLFSLIYLNLERLSKIINKIWLYSTIVFICVLLFFTKETSIVLVVSLTIFHYIFKKRDRRFFYPIIVPTLLVITGLLVSSVGVKNAIVEGEYNFNIIFLIKNVISWISLLSNTLSPLFKIYLLVLIFIAVNPKLSGKIFTFKYVFWLLLMFFFMAIFFPWPFVLARYLFLSIYFFSIINGITLVKVFSFLKENIDVYLRGFRFGAITFWLISGLAIINVLSSYFSVNLAQSINFTAWNRSFLTFEHEQIASLASLHQDKIYINAKDNIDDWEVLYELPIHLSYFYHQTPKLVLLTDQLPASGILFTRSSMDLSINTENLDKKTDLIASHSYTANQIETVLFRDEFKYKPIQSLMKPPLTQKPLTYYWEIRKINEN